MMLSFRLPLVRAVFFAGVALALSLLLAQMSLATAARAEESKEEWSFQITPYVWLPTLTGDFEGGGGSGPSFSTRKEVDLLDVLDFAFLVAGEARYGRFGLLGEFNYLSLSADASPNILWNDADIDVDGIMTSLSAAYRVYEERSVDLDVFAGARFWSLTTKVDFDLTGLGGRLFPVSPSSKSTVNIFDPIVGMRIEVRPWDDIFLGAMGNVGGFGVGSDFQWELLGQAGYRFNDTLSASLGYRHIAMKPEKEAVDKVKFSGPFLTVGFRF